MNTVALVQRVLAATPDEVFTDWVDPEALAEGIDLRMHGARVTDCRWLIEKSIRRA